MSQQPSDGYWDNGTFIPNSDRQFQDENGNPPPAQSGQPAQAAASNRWSYHLANDPYGGAAGQWAKQYYDNPNIDPGAAIQQQLSSFREQYGAAAPADDASAIAMIASGQRPGVATNQFPVQPFPSQVATVQSTPRNTALYDLLVGRAQQGLNIDRNDPIIRGQADAYTANEDRARRNYLGDIAEKAGPLANIRGEERMSAERVGQRSGAFESQLMGRELESRRNEIQQAISQMGSMLSDEEKLALQRELGLLNSAIQSQLGNANIGIQQGQLDLQQALGMGRLGLDAEQQAAYWDWIKQGGRLN